ncbi:unnamed protein product [Paramecium pentaurelia]|uniref:Macro domain-containing protein n=1 Tax=Paramecium pentaurelia TaxID=43138 RepID=A0A8S1VMH3_9CILI|nr:unnamed protein product [Paramecium pentaurelia]
MNFRETQKKLYPYKRPSINKKLLQGIQQQDGSQYSETFLKNFDSIKQQNIKISVKKNCPEDKEQQKGYEISVKIAKENSFDEAYQEKLIQFIKKFFFNGQFQLTLSYPHIMGENQKNDLSKEFKDLQFQMKEIVFDESDYLFYQKIYQFKGQEKFGISADLQMLIFDKFIFQDLESKARKEGYHFECNYKEFQCSIPTPNYTLHDIKKQMQFFVNNVYNTLNKYDIIEIDTKTKQESQIIYKLVQKYQKEMKKQMNTEIFPVIINLNNLQQKPEKQLDGDFIKNIIQKLKFDKLYLVLEKNEKDLDVIQQEFMKFMNSSNNIFYDSYNYYVQFKEPQEDEFFNQQFENLQKEFNNISIYVSLPKQINYNEYEVQILCETWQEILNNPSKFKQDCNYIIKKLQHIYTPYIQIRMKDQQKILIWKEYLQSQLDKQLIQYITDGIKSSNRNENQNDFIIRISTILPQYEEEQRRIKQQLENFQLSIVDVYNDNVQLQKFIAENIDKDEFENILNNFQQQENAKIAQIKLFALQGQKFQFKVIHYNKYSRNDIEDVIKSQFINDLKQQEIKFPFISFLKYQKLEIPKQITDKDILSVIPKDNKQNVIIIGKNQDILKFQDIIKEIEKKYQDNRMKIQLFIKQKSLSDEILKILKQQDFCYVSYDQRKYIQTIEFLKQDFDIIYNLLKNLEQSYETCKVLILDVNDQKKIEKINLKEIEKKEQVIIDIQSVSIINPLKAEGFLLNIGYNKKIKFIKGNISQIQCQAIVLEFLKNVDFSEERLQNDQIKNIINFIQGENNKKELLQEWKFQIQEQDIIDIHCQKLKNHKNLIDYLFQIYPKFNRQAASLENNLLHIKSLITKVFQKSKEHNITQIAFPLIGVGLFGYNLKEIQQVLIQEIISQLSYQNCQISQVFVQKTTDLNMILIYNDFILIIVIQNEQDYRQVQEYCKIISNNTNLNQSNYNQQSFITQVASCQIEIDGDLIDIEDSYVIEQISYQYQLLKQGQQIEPFTITHPYSKYPFTHSIDLKNNKMIQEKNNTQQKIEFIDLFKQRIYFIDQQQVSESLNQYLLLKHEQNKLNEFKIYYAQDEVKVINSQFYIKTNFFENFQKVFIKYKKDQFKQEILINFEQFEQQGEETDNNDLKWQLEILSDNIQKIKRAIDSINQRRI